MFIEVDDPLPILVHRIAKVIRRAHQDRPRKVVELIENRDYAGYELRSVLGLYHRIAFEVIDADLTQNIDWTNE